MKSEQLPQEDTDTRKEQTPCQPSYKLSSVPPSPFPFSPSPYPPPSLPVSYSAQSPPTEPNIVQEQRYRRKISFTFSQCRGYMVLMARSSTFLTSTFHLLLPLLSLNNPTAGGCLSFIQIHWEICTKMSAGFCVYVCHTTVTFNECYLRPFKLVSKCTVQWSLLSDHIWKKSDCKHTNASQR